MHLFNHALIKATLFMVMGAVMLRIGSVHIEDMRGVGRQMPWTMFAFVIGGLSLIGVPLTVGFVSKWYLILAALETGGYGIAIALLVLLSSLLAVIYVWRVVETAYFKPATRPLDAVREAPLTMLAPIWLLAAANLYFGVDTRVTVGVAREAARFLLGGGA